MPEGSSFLPTAWFIVLSFMLTGYAVLDGYDLGVGALHLFTGRSDRSREMAIDAIGPVWNGNEVWLLAAGGSMIAAFPHLYASAFSGFYLALMLVLWLLVLRGLSIEFRHQVHHAIWTDAWDVGFAVGSILLAVLLGAALGNVLRGVPLQEDGSFQGSFALLLNPFALLCGVLSLVTLSMHGAAYLAMKVSGELQARASRLVIPLWVGTVALLVAVVAASFVVQPAFTANFQRWPLLAVFPLIAIAAAAAIPVMHRAGRDGAAFGASATLIAGTLASAAAGLYPRLLPALPGSAHPSLDIYNTASAPSSQAIALGIYLVGMAIVIVYMVNVYRVWRGRVGEEHTYQL
ncbi:MAG TPA: cytochrome d ubiquinol oxidase subunit II [Vicinamibacterales bacterium]|nr:cytochrome d ubiquinol oxidase subunit II [Vicinamibacterales bacterium]